MKTERTLLTVVLVACEALAAGGSNTQGTLYAGTGFDWQRTATSDQQVPYFQSPTWPPPSTTGDPLSAPWMGVEIRLTSCAQISNTFYASCKARVRLKSAIPESHFCGVSLAKTKLTDGSIKWIDNFQLYAIDATLDAKGGFSFNPSAGARKFMLACSPQDINDIKDSEWKELGAIGKCILWNRPPNISDPNGMYPPMKAAVMAESAKEFKTCVRAVRADYCGDGVSYTKDGTVIDLYRASIASAHEPQPAFIMEANWKEDGAICILHPRYVALSAECQRRYQNFVGLVPKPDPGTSRGLLGNEYWCLANKYDMPWGCKTDKDGLDRCNYVVKAQELLRSGILMDDSLIQP
jgi:hypothetical protein